MIKLQAIGHIGKDAVINNVNSKTVINFNIAHTEKYRDAQGMEVNKTVWIACAYWTEKTKVAQYLLKGSQVYVDGTPDVKMYKDNQGTNHANIILRVNNIQLLGSKKEDSSGNNYNQQNQNNNQQEQFKPTAVDISLTQDDDLPF